MPLLIQYLLKVSCSIAVVYLFYQFILRYLTFYTWNRWYLLLYSLLCFFIPFINVSPYVESNVRLTREVNRFIPPIDPFTGKSGIASVSEGSGTGDLWKWIFPLMVIMAILLLFRFFLQYWSFFRLKKRSVLISGGAICIYQVNESINPFSFGKNIFINRNLHSQEELEKILHHEFIHVQQKHSIDIIASEVFCALNWYNPFAWLIRHSIRQNLEFIADQQVLQTGIDKKQYQYLLLKVTGALQFRFTSQFNINSLKNRIVMMNKMATAKVHLLKFLFLLPVIAILLLAFRNRHTDSPMIHYAGIVFDQDSKQPVPGVRIEEKSIGLVTFSDERGYYTFDVKLERDKEYRLRLSKDEYGKESSSIFSVEHKITGSVGVVEVNALRKGNQNMNSTDRLSYLADPYVKDQVSYEQAKEMLTTFLESLENINNEFETKNDKEEPEVLYVTADNIFWDGSKNILTVSGNVHMDNAKAKTKLASGKIDIHMENEIVYFEGKRLKSSTSLQLTHLTGVYSIRTMDKVEAERTYGYKGSGKVIDIRQQSN